MHLPITTKNHFSITKKITHTALRVGYALQKNLFTCSVKYIVVKVKLSMTIYYYKNEKPRPAWCGF